VKFSVEITYKFAMFICITFIKIVQSVSLKDSKPVTATISIIYALLCTAVGCCGRVVVSQTICAAVVWKQR